MDLDAVAKLNLMMTTKGEIDEKLLEKRESREKVPCGDCISTKYFDASGEMVREDIRIEVDRGYLMRALQGA